MKGKILSCTLMLLLASLSFLEAQNLTPKVVQADAFLKRLSTGNANNILDVGQRIPTMPPRSGTKINEVYLDDHWRLSSILIYGAEKAVDGFLVKYDLRSNSLEFNMPDQIKVMDVRRVKTLIWVDSLGHGNPQYFVNGKDFFLGTSPLTALVEVLVQGKMSLYKQYSYWIKKPDYQPSLDVGSRDERIYKKDIFYCGEGAQLKGVPTKKKDFYSVFGDKADTMHKYADDNDLKVTEEADMVKVFEYYNSTFLN